MSANLLDGATPEMRNGAYAVDGGFQLKAYSGAAGTHQDQLIFRIGGQEALAENQTIHMSFAVKGDVAAEEALKVSVGYTDSAGNINWRAIKVSCTESWSRQSGTLVVPSGMTVTGFYVSPMGGSPDMQVTSPTLSYGSPVVLARAAHGAYTSLEDGNAAAAAANDAKTAAGNAQATADTATKNAAAAQSTADDAKSAASTAQTTADSAKSSASAAQTTADTAKSDAAAAQSTADAASTAASKAQTTADTASAQANATASHFWLDAAGQANVSTDAGTVGTGHSVTIGSKGIIQRLDGQLMQSLTKTALNFYLAQAGTPQLAAMYTPDGMGVFAAGKQLSSFTGSGAVFYDGTTDSPTTANVTASFGSDGAIIGKKSGANVEVDSDSVSFMDGGTRMGYISDSRLNMSAGDFKTVSVGKYVLRVDSNGTFVLGM